MTVTAEVPLIEHTANGVATVFAYDFELPAAADLLVQVDGVTKTLTTDYSVAGFDDPAGGSVTFVTAPANLSKVLLRRNIAFERTTDYQNLGDFLAPVVNNDFDRIWFAIQQLQADLRRMLRAPEYATVNELPTIANRASKLLGWDSTGQPIAVAPTSGSAADLALDLASTASAAEGAGQVGYDVDLAYAALTVGHRLKAGGVFLKADCGATGDGSTNDTTNVQAALNRGVTLMVEPGTYLVDNLTWTASSVQMIALGTVIFKKRANGDMLTISGDEVLLRGIQFRGDAASPTFTGDNLVIAGDNCVLDKCGSRWAYARAVRCTGSRLRIFGSCDIYQTAGSGGSDYDIDIGDSGTATLYHVIHGVQSTQSTGGIRMIDVGGVNVSQCQFGKLGILASNIMSPPTGVGSNSIASNRITGNVTVEIANSTFSNNAVSAVTVAFASGTSGHNFDESNLVAVGATLTDSSTGSNVVDIRLMTLQTYTTTWTGSGSNPSLGNGTLSARYFKRGKSVFAVIALTIGSTTTLGSGFWTFTLPSSANTNVRQFGSGRAVIGGTQYNLIPRTSTGGSANCLLSVNATGNDVGAANPGSWANGDLLEFTIEYLTD